MTRVSFWTWECAKVISSKQYSTWCDEEEDWIWFIMLYKYTDWRNDRGASVHIFHFCHQHINHLRRRSDSMMLPWINKGLGVQQSLLVTLNKVITQLHLFKRCCWCHTHAHTENIQCSVAAVFTVQLAVCWSLLFRNSGEVSSSAVSPFFNKQPLLGSIMLCDCLCKFIHA